MNTLTDSARSAVYRDGKIVLTMQSGTEFSFPVLGNPRLAGGKPRELGNIEISPFGLHWPDLDEDLSIRGILAGDYGQNKIASHEPPPRAPVSEERG